MNALYLKFCCAAAEIAAKGAAERVAERGGTASACCISWIKLLETVNNPSIFSLSTSTPTRRAYPTTKYGLFTAFERCGCLVGEGS